MRTETISYLFLSEAIIEEKTGKSQISGILGVKGQSFSK